MADKIDARAMLEALGRMGIGRGGMSIGKHVPEEDRPRLFTVTRDIGDQDPHGVGNAASSRPETSARGGGPSGTDPK